MSFIKIGNNTIGRGLKPYIIAEAGINHNGELEKALKMIEVAKNSISIDMFTKLINCKNVNSRIITSPAHGLYLNRINY